MRTFQKICVFCGSSAGSRPEYAEAARRTGETLAHRGITMIYGGGSVGLMGVAADAALGAGGKVIGVIPHGLRTKELAHKGVTELIAVESMHERKQRMVDLADAFVALPGGIGTMDELFETWTWLQLGIHSRPIGLLNVAGYFDPLLAFLQRMRDERFIRSLHLRTLLMDESIDGLLGRLERFQAPDGRKWVEDGAPLEP
ncbi:MAG: TIGR00730 family Rossman fold protein [Burkholderiales bacterium]